MTKQIMVGSVPVGGGAAVSIQSMCNTKTHDVPATRTISHPAAASFLIWFTVAVTSWVGVLVMDWMDIGASPPMVIFFTCTARVFRLMEFSFP